MAPTKASVYTNYLPSSYNKVNDRSDMDILADHFSNDTDVIVSYAKNNLIELRDNYSLYFPRDTHWTSIGALVALDPVFSQLGLSVPDSFSEYNIVQGEIVEMDLPNLCGLYDVFPPCHDYVVADYSYTRDPRSVVVMGDSYSLFFMNYLNARFSGVERYDIRSTDLYTAIASQPDILILEANEEYLQALINMIVNNSL